MGRGKTYRLTRDGPFCLHGDSKTYYRGNPLPRLRAKVRDALLDLGWIEEVEPSASESTGEFPQSGEHRRAARRASGEEE